MRASPACAVVLLCLMTQNVSLWAVEYVPFMVCRESYTWTRPAPNIQARVWNDPRYRGLEPDSLREWTHDFIMVEADSASIQYHAENTSGLWTEGVFSPTCSDRKDTEWIAVWVLLHRVRSIEIAGDTYTVRVDPTAEGFQSILIRRVHPLGSLRFVDANGSVIDRIDNRP